MPTPNKGTGVTEGACTYHHAGAPTGHERWQLMKLAHGGLVFSSRIERTSPQAATLNYTFEVTQHWAPVSLTARRDAGNTTLTTEQRAVGAQWQARIEPRGGAAQDLALDFSPQHEITFASPLILTAALYRLNLQVGQSREVDVIVIDPTTFVPRAAKQTFSCVAEENIEVPAGKFSAWQYKEGENQFWADRNGVVLLYQAASGDTIKLARYRRIERR
jgi:hypothetical protein